MPQSDPTTAPPPPRNPGIDLLRGVCVLLVVIHHLAIRYPLHQTALGEVLPRRLLNALGYNGFEAVCVFFVISGFLITHHSLRRWGALAAIELRGFYVRRAARILPCLLALLIVLSGLHLLGVEYYVINPDRQSLGGALASALGLYLNWYEGQTGWLPGGWDVLWSLSIEESFYLAFPLLCLLVRSRLVLVCLLLILALSLPFTRALLDGQEIWQEKAYLPGMAAIATGVLAALLAERAAPSRGWTWLLQLLGVVGILAVLLCGRELWMLLRHGLMLVLTLSAASLLLGLHWGRRVAVRAGPPWHHRLTGWLRSCGRVSYEIYLTHMFVVFAIVAAWKASGIDPRHAWICYPPLLLACWALGWWVARSLSEPADRALRRRWLRAGGTHGGAATVTR